MKEAILDTDMLSYALSKRYADVQATARQYTRVFHRLSVSAITVSEVVQGIAKHPDHHERLSAFLHEAETLEVFPFYREEALLAGRIMGALLQIGQPIGPHDPFIAATAIENKRVLITNNVKHYQRIVDLGFALELDNWRAS